MRGSPWTPDAQAILEREAGRRPAAEIAEMTGHSEKTITRHLRAAGLTAYHWRRQQLMSDAAGIVEESN